LYCIVFTNVTVENTVENGISQRNKTCLISCVMSLLSELRPG